MLRILDLSLADAGISTFDLSRYMGASLTMIDRHYGLDVLRDGTTSQDDALDRR